MRRVFVSFYIPEEYELACPFIRTPKAGEQFMVFGPGCGALCEEFCSTVATATEGDELLDLPRVIVKPVVQEGKELAYAEGVRLGGDSGGVGVGV